jgi:hypothetical protein
VETTVFAGGGGTNIMTNAWRTNSMYDPNYATGGHQPMYFDQLGLFYKFYSVLSSTISVRFQNTAFAPYLAIVRVQDGLTAPAANFDSYMEQPGVAARLVTNANAVTLTRRWSCKGMDRSDNIGTFGNFGTGSDPVITPLFTVTAAMQDTAGTFAAGNPQVTVTVRYKALLTQRIDVAGS